MHLPTTTDYAIRILQQVQKHAGEVQTTMDIVTATGINYPSVMKIAVRLRNAGLLNVVLGRCGGYTLGKRAEDISVYDVFAAVEGALQIKDGLQSDPIDPEGEQGDGDLDAFLSDLQDKMIAELSEISLADLT